MPPRKLTLTDDELRNLDRQGWRREDIAEMFNVTGPAVVHRYVAMGEAKSVPRYAKYLPWTVATEHLHHPLAVRLRWLEHRERNLEQGLEPGDGLPEWAPAMVDRMLEDLREQGAVIEYDVMSEDGFRLVRATPAELANHAAIREER